MTKYNTQPFSTFDATSAQLTEGMPIEDEPIVAVEPLPFDKLPTYGDLPEWFYQSMKGVYAPDSEG